MKNIIYIIVLTLSTGLYAQSSIETDELYLKYEKEYKNSSEMTQFALEYENAIESFYSGFEDSKRLRSFEKTNNKNQWLKRNFSKINFSSANEALDSYEKLIQTKEKLDNANKKLGDLHKELSQKYDTTLIWETLQTRLKK